MFEPKSYWEAKHDDAKKYIASLERAKTKLEKQNDILKQALKAASPLAYKLIMQEVNNVTRETKGE